MELDLEERIRCLEAVNLRARQRERRPSHVPIQITNFAGESVTIVHDVHDEGRVHEKQLGIDVEGEMLGQGRMGKRKCTYLIAKALGVARDGNLFDCNICLDMARDPVLTCCGHLFCWPCFHKLSCAYSNVKECPVCEGEVTEEGIIPIYGNANIDNSDQIDSNETGLSVPPRPHARRITSMMQQIRN
ncbi:hypothetical protein Fmac_018483 [Flemingia macrophylla]|uniref:E3 ubiquitin-protein ligase RMA n=1 Tax=Flemingia macrophylla TaxID=520843 RepID=A0ABD1M5I4_9FABA